MTRPEKTRAERIEAALREAFAPKVVQVVDDSESHRGHAGFQEGGGSHFIVTVESDKFQGLSRIARHRMVHTAIGPDLMSEIHALALTIRD
ncbi:BolA family transcriptional regulator [Rhodobacteraceae bacterium N5(2021)]|uniref:BolA family transcriptional regulator n=1 Tax=Gymnodinialimonas phycosphaerae TaxID=2841589 RepID=A0A975YHU4_9RHOB|nr:BolA family protein [Gymnodinialimonas phycosphaerae]MBY4891665.1 BolA family transcriptional regulator [Gymnodinialimonas phycosphaerae]